MQVHLTLLKCVNLVLHTTVKRLLLKAVFSIWQFLRTKITVTGLHISKLHSRLWKIFERGTNFCHLLLTIEHLNISTHECIAPTLAHMRLPWLRIWKASLLNTTPVVVSNCNIIKMSLGKLTCHNKYSWTYLCFGSTIHSRHWSSEWNKLVYTH